MFYRHALEYLKLPRSEKKKKKKKSYGNAWPFLAFSMACGWRGHVFATSANPRSWKKNVTMSPSSTVHGGQYYTKYLLCIIRIDGASGICGGGNFRPTRTSSHQRRDRNTRNRTRRYYHLVACIIQIDGATGISEGRNFRRLSWTRSYQRRDRNTWYRTRRYYILLPKNLQDKCCLNNCIFIGSRYYNMVSDPACV